MSIQLRDGLANQPVDHIMEDLLVRFVVNCPEEDLSSIERVFFQVEEAQWFYTDFIRQLNAAFPSMKMKGFAPRLLSKCPLLWKWGDPADALSQFGKYKSTIPVRGIALLNKDMTKMILVQGTESNLWSFPRGKISKDEDDLVCAVREVKEETGFDATNHVNEKDVVERTVYGKNFKIYLARNVPEDFKFEPEVRNEIALIQWHDIKGLQKAVKQQHNKYFIVGPFLKPLTRWINRNKGVVNEEELMRSAEQKLKQLMGIAPAPSVAADAGRELLNILQGAAEPLAPTANFSAGSPSAIPQPQQYIQMNVPQHLQSFYAGMNSMPQFFPPAHPNGYIPVQPLLRAPQFNGGFFANQGPQGPQIPQVPQMPGQFAPHQMQQSPVQPILQSPGAHATHTPQAQTVPIAQAPDALSLSTSSANSKELLSILKGGSLKSAPQPPNESRPNESRAGEFLQMLNKKPEATDQRKVNVLKRDKTSLESDALATLLGLLGKKPTVVEKQAETTTPAPKQSNASAELLGLLNKKQADKKEESPAENKEHSDVERKIEIPLRNVPDQQPVAQPKPEKKDAAAELLGLIGRKPSKDKKETETRQTSQSADVGTASPAPRTPINANENKKASNELLDILNQPKMPLRIAKRDTQSPADLKSVLGGSASPQETPATLILSTLNRKSATPQPKFTPQPTPPQDFEDFENFEDFEDFDEISSSQHEIYNSIANTFNADSEEEYETEKDLGHTQPQAQSQSQSQSQSQVQNLAQAQAHDNGHTAGQHLLLLLNGGKPSPGNLQDTYGNAAPAPAPQVSAPTSSNGADILRILGRRPTETNQSGNDLLNILKGGR